MLSRFSRLNQQSYYFSSFHNARTFFQTNFKFYSTDISNVGPKKDNTLIKKDVLNQFIKRNPDITPELVVKADRTGADLYLTPEKLEIVEKGGFLFKDLNHDFDLNTLEKDPAHNFYHNYFERMNLYHDYNEVFRTFLQVICLNNQDGLHLVAEERLRNYISYVIHNLKTEGYNIELGDLRILQNYEVLRVEIYKNLKMNRFGNHPYSDYNFSKITTPLGSCLTATHVGEDLSYFHNDKPYILATTMRVRTPMKIQVFNQNLTRKLHGGNDSEVLDYIVRFESQFNLNDFGWVLKTQNKPNRLRQTRITDFNNALRGNPFFFENFDLLGTKENRYKYMRKGEHLDHEYVRNIKKVHETPFFI